jgi:hypothetical protein
MMATFGTFVDGVSLKASELNGFLGATSWTPTITQGASLGTAGGTEGFYFRVNKLIICRFVALPVNTGTALNRVEINLPVTASSNSARVIGTCFFRDTSANTYRHCRVVQYSTTSMAFITETATSLTSYFGNTNGPAVQVTSTDSFRGYAIYEAA